ncbi:xanthine dehydrogenase family protein molybdopterin-binding subunit [Neolewinella aurantiaca]|uniref:Xanthine dehydrogenase family protein molybdopterin-binding subunit n=1 Tax=Neolewinella aurantiaca TaxID=2602767 RepID=A0A5C7FQW6_9BACT|nr:molybdopterin cofactor-binding domain-containing protein [Neolewinella aurantiaca]TXF88441.1 xanthine dehydrogenase family protein molybdopterin-binding subunit [Neolewinella aurantiaca]
MSQSRRKFLIKAGIGTGLLFGTAYCLPIRRKIAGMVNTAESPYLGPTNDPKIWFEVTPDNQIIFHSPKMEMGQGVFTGLAQIAADELEVGVEQIKVVHASTGSGNIDKFATGGSTSINSLWKPLRELAATMRMMLINAAADQLGVAASGLSTLNGVISGAGKSITYGEVAAAVTDWEIPDTPELKDPKTYKFIGKPTPRVDLMDKVTGAPIYGMDAEMPGMLFGSVARPEGLDSKFTGVDTSVAEGMPGVVKVIVEDDFVGVVADSFVNAEKAKEKLNVNWEINRKWDDFDVEAAIKVGQGKPIEIQKEGNAKKLLKDGEEGIIQSEYFSPIGAHAQIEPNGCLAYVEDDKVTLRMSTQVAEITRKEVASRLGFSKDEVILEPTFLGGGFGRRLHTPNAIQAAVMSKAVGKPVKCFFSRKEEFQNDTFRPPTHNVLKGKLTADGKIEALSHDISSGDVMYGSPLVPGILQKVIGADLGAWRGGMIQYHGIPNYRAVSWRVKLPFATSWWRSLGLLANTFAVESFMDELAEAAGKDPVSFRLDHLSETKADVRLAKVIAKAAEVADYQNEPFGPTDESGNYDRAMGFACSTDVNTPCAHVAEVSIVDGEIKVHKVTCVMDPGLVINPDQVRAQCEGSIIMGMSAVLYEKMTVEDNALYPVIYGAYEMALMKDAPKEIDVVLLENDDNPGGVGEPPMGPIGAAIANAVYRLTKKRVRRIPLRVS